MGERAAHVARAWLAGLISSAVVQQQQRQQQQAAPESTPRKDAETEPVLSPPFTVSPDLTKRPPLERVLKSESEPDRESELDPTPQVHSVQPETPAGEVEPKAHPEPSPSQHDSNPQAGRALPQDNRATIYNESLHEDDVTRGLSTSISCLPPLDELEQVTRANLKAMRQVRRGLRKARKSLEHVPVQQEAARRAGEAAGTTIVERLRRDAVRRELRTSGLSSQVAWPGWRAHVALEEPGGAAGDVVLTPAIASAQANLNRLADTTDFRPQRTGGAVLSAVELRGRVAAARAAVCGEPLPGHIDDASSLISVEQEDEHTRPTSAASASVSASALRWATGDSAEALIDETWLRCKVIGDGEKIGEATVLVCEGPLAGETVVVRQDSHLRAVDHGITTSGVRLAQAQEAYDDLRDGIAESYGSLSELDRKVLDRAVSELREAIESLAFHEKHGREQVPLELARYMRMRVGLIRRRSRGRNRRYEMNDDRRYPICGRCAKRARGYEDTTNSTWYCNPCWAEWESGHRALQLENATSSGAEDLGIHLGRVVPGSWIRGSCSSASIAAGATIVEQRRTIADLQSEVATLKRYRRELEEGYIESGQLFDQLEGVQAASRRLDAIEANVRQEQAWRDKRESDAQPSVHLKAARPRMRYNRRAVFGRNAVVAPAGDSLPENALGTDTRQCVDSDTRPSSSGSARPDHTSSAGNGLPPSSLRTALIGTTKSGVGRHNRAAHVVR